MEFPFFNSSETDITVRLGDEYDEKLCGILKRVLSEKGAKKTKEWWGLVGAQEMSFYVYMIGDEEITVEQETYIGLSNKGPEKLVREIAEEVSRPSKQEARDVK